MMPRQMADIALVQYPGPGAKSTASPPCGKVHMALQFKGLAYRVISVTTPMEIKKHNPRGRVPALIVDGRVTVDSTDILTEIDRLFPDPPLAPEGAVAQAQAKVLEDWADEVIYFYLVWLRFGDDAGWPRFRQRFLARHPAPMRWIVPPIARRIAVGRCKGQGVGLKGTAVVRRELSECLQALSALLSQGPYLVGPRLSRADIAVCAVIDQLRRHDLTPEAAGEIDAMPGIVAWCDRVHAQAPSAC